MNCDKCISLLEAHVESELGESESIQVTTHLAACSECSLVFDDLLSEQRVYSQYLIGVEPSTDLWEGINAGIRTQKQGLFGRIRQYLKEALVLEGFDRRFAGVASVFLFVIVGFAGGIALYKWSNGSESKNSAGNRNAVNQEQDILVAENFDSQKEIGNQKADRLPVNNSEKNLVKRRPIQKVNFRSKPILRRKQAKIAVKSPELAAMAETEIAVRKAEEYYLSAIDLLSNDIRKKQVQLSAESVSLIRKSDQVIKETRRALKREPRNPIMVQYMTTAYSKKIELLRIIVSE